MIFWIASAVELAGGVLVAWGCLGELRLFFNKSLKNVEATEGELRFWRIFSPLIENIVLLLTNLKLLGVRISEGKEYRLERKYIAMVALGVSMEVMPLPFSIWESVKMSMEVAQLTRNNLELQKTVLELESKVKARTINSTQLEDFKKLMSLVPKIPIRISLGQEGFDTETFAKQMRDLFNYAGFKADPGAGAYGVSRDPSRVWVRNIGNTNDFPEAAILLNSTNDALNKQFSGKWITQIYQMPALNLYTNFPPVPVINDTNAMEDICSRIGYGFTQIGITWRMFLVKDQAWLKPGEFEIFIPIKNQ
jgi:hypothetical protein